MTRSQKRAKRFAKRARKAREQNPSPRYSLKEEMRLNWLKQQGIEKPTPYGKRHEILVFGFNTAPR